MKRHCRAPSSPYLLEKEPFASHKRAVASMQTLVGATRKDRIYANASALQMQHMLFEEIYKEMEMEGKNHVLFCGTYAKELFNSRCLVEPLPLCKGQIDLEILEKSINPKTALISLSWAESSVGVLQPVWDLASFCQEKGILLHVDISAVIGKIYFQWRDLPIDFLTLDGGLIGAEGAAALFVKEEVALPFSLMEKTAACFFNKAVALGMAAAETEQSLDYFATEGVRLRNNCAAALEKSGIKVLFPSQARLPNQLLLSFPGVHYELLSFALADKNIYTSFYTDARGKERLCDRLQEIGVEAHLAYTALPITFPKNCLAESMATLQGHIVDTYLHCQRYAKEL